MISGPPPPSVHSFILIVAAYDLISVWNGQYGHISEQYGHISEQFGHISAHIGYIFAQ